MRFIKSALFIFVLSCVLLEFGFSVPQGKQIPINMTSMIIDAILNSDSSVSYKQTINYIYAFNNSEAENKSLVQTFFLPQDAKIEAYPGVRELIGENSFTLVNSVENIHNCLDKYSFNPKTNSITICSTPKNELRFEVTAILLPKPNYESMHKCKSISSTMPIPACIAKENSSSYDCTDVSNEFKLILPGTDNDYFSTIKIRGGDGVISTTPNNTACIDQNIEQNGAVSNLTLYNYANGFICQGTIFRNPETLVELVFNPIGLSELVIKNKQQLEEKQWQKNQQEKITAASERQAVSAQRMTDASQQQANSSWVIAFFAFVTLVKSVIEAKVDIKIDKWLFRMSINFKKLFR